MKYVLATICPVAAGIAAGVASANGSPYSPGLVYGWNGVGAGDGLRYVAFGMPKSTIVAAVRARDGRVLRSKVVRGDYGVPLVAYDGTPGGLSGDGKSLVLGSYGPLPGQSGKTRFLVLDTKTLAPRRAIVLDGSWSFDAVSPTASTLYLTEHLRAGDKPLYRVRHLRRPLGQPPRRDRRPPGRRRGDGRPARGEGVECRRPLGVHALRASRRRAVRACARHGEARGVLYRPAAARRVRSAVGAEPRARPRRPVPVRAPTAAARSPPSTRAPGR